MKQIYQTSAQKRPYMAPELLIVRITSTQMVCTSGPDVYTSTDPADSNSEILTRENRNFWGGGW